MRTNQNSNRSRGFDWRRLALTLVIALAAACSSEVTAPGAVSNDRRDGDSAADADGDTSDLPTLALQHATEGLLVREHGPLGVSAHP